MEKLEGGLATIRKTVCSGGQNKTGPRRLASEATCEPRAPKGVPGVRVLRAGLSESSMWWLLTLLIGCDIR